MAATIAAATGKGKRLTALGNESSTGEANTWRTFSTTHIRADGRGSFELKRDGARLVELDWNPEDAEVSTVKVRAFGESVDLAALIELVRDLAEKPSPDLGPIAELQKRAAGLLGRAQ